MLSEKMTAAMNRQINGETYSAYLYWSMEAFFKDQALDGFANWMRIQAMEEMTHAMKFFDQINERDGRVELDAIEKPQGAWDSVKGAFDAVYEHEQKVTAMINELMDLAVEEKDHASQAFLQWFVEEQVEEEASAKDICEQLRFIGDNPQGVFMLNRELGSRVFTPPAAEAE